MGAASGCRHDTRNKETQAVTQAPPTPLAKLRKPRQFSQPELEARFPIDCTILPKTREVRVNPAWERKQLVKVRFPESVPIHNSFWLHKDAAPVFLAWFALIDKEGLSKHIVTFNGSYVPRLKRGDNVPTTKYGLSRHSRGLAIDINAMWNPMGKPPAPLGALGCVLPLVPLMHEVGLVWGGDWGGASCDAMHFELGTFDE